MFCGREKSECFLGPFGSECFEILCPERLSDKRDLFYHLEAHLDLNNSWAIADDTDEIVWVNYTLEVPEKFSFKTLEDLRLVSASGFILTLTLSTGEIEFSEMESFQRAAYTRTSFNDFLGRFFGNYTPPVPHPDCGTKSRVLRKLAAEIDQSSTLSDLEQFFGDLGELRKRSIQAEVDRDNGTKRKRGSWDRFPSQNRAFIHTTPSAFRKRVDFKFH